MMVAIKQCFIIQFIFPFLGSFYVFSDCFFLEAATWTVSFFNKVSLILCRLSSLPFLIFLSVYQQDSLRPQPLHISNKCLSLTLSTCSLLLCANPHLPCSKANPFPQTSVSPQLPATVWHRAINMSAHKTHTNIYTHTINTIPVQNTLLQYKYLSINA